MTCSGTEPNAPHDAAARCERLRPGPSLEPRGVPDASAPGREGTAARDGSSDATRRRPQVTGLLTPTTAQHRGPRRRRRRNAVRPPRHGSRCAHANT